MPSIVPPLGNNSLSSTRCELDELDAAAGNVSRVRKGERVSTAARDGTCAFLEGLETSPERLLLSSVLLQIATLIVLGTAWCVFVPTVHVPVFPLLSALVYAAVFVWAAVGIGVKATGGVRITAYVMAVIVAVVSVGVIGGRR